MVRYMVDEVNQNKCKVMEIEQNERPDIDYHLAGNNCRDQLVKGTCGNDIVGGLPPEPDVKSISREENHIYLSAIKLP